MKHYVHNYAGLSLVSACLLVFPALAGPGESLLSLPVARFEYHGRSKTSVHMVANAPAELPGAALDLAHHAHVRICIEGGRHTLIPIEIDVRDSTVGEILEKMIRQDPSYEYRERLGVIEVLPVGAANDPSDCLNMVIPKFVVHYPWRIAWGQVRCQISMIAHDPRDIVPDLRAVGRCWASSHSPAPPKEVLYAVFEKRTVRDILNTLAAKAGNAAWFVSDKYSTPYCEDMQQQIADYEPTTIYPIPDTTPPRYTDKMPSECLKCHYHRE